MTEKKNKKKSEFLQSNLFPLCLASFILLVSLDISGRTLFSLAASRWPFTMTGNTAIRATTVPTRVREMNRNRKEEEGGLEKTQQGSHTLNIIFKECKDLSGPSCLELKDPKQHGPRNRSRFRENVHF